MKCSEHGFHNVLFGINLTDFVFTLPIQKLLVCQNIRLARIFHFKPKEQQKQQQTTAATARFSNMLSPLTSDYVVE